MVSPGWTQLSLLILSQLLPCFCASSSGIFDDYEQCRASGRLGPSAANGSLVCDASNKLSPKAVAQLEEMLADLSHNAGCECAGGCGGREYAVRLVVSGGKGAEAEDGMEQEAERIWESEGMGGADGKCDNGMLLVYLRDQKKMATYQGHGRFRTYDDRQIADLHELVMRGANASGTLTALPSPGGDAPTAAEIQRAEDDEGNWTPLLGLSIALGLTFLVLFCLLLFLLAKCCFVCFVPRGRGAKYRVSPGTGLVAPGAGYKSMDPIYIVTPAGSEAAAAAFVPPSGATLPRRGFRSPAPAPPPPPMMFFGHPPPPQHHPGPFVLHPRSRSATPTPTQRIRRRSRLPSGGQAAGQAGTEQSMHSTPEAHKRDKVSATERAATNTARSNGTALYATANNSSPESASGVRTRRRPSPPPPPNTRDNGQLQPYPFLDPKRRQETQTREEFIG